MNDPSTPLVVDDDDACSSCNSVYLSFIDTQGGEHPSKSPITTIIDPPTDTSTMPEPDSLQFKDQRSYERARQRLKKPHDIYKARQCWCKYGCKPCRVGNKGLRKGRIRDGGLRPTCLEGPREHEDSKLDTDDSCEVDHDGQHAVLPPVNRDVSLADLVRAPRKQSAKQFEIISRPRQVLVFDEFPEVDAVKPDFDDWEHINVDCHRKPRAPSYARIVASRA